MIDLVPHLEMFLKMGLACSVLCAYIITCLLLKSGPLRVVVVNVLHLRLGDFIHGWLAWLTHSFPLKCLDGVPGQSSNFASFSIVDVKSILVSVLGESGFRTLVSFRLHVLRRCAQDARTFVSYHRHRLSDVVE